MGRAGGEGVLARDLVELHVHAFGYVYVYVHESLSVHAFTYCLYTCAHMYVCARSCVCVNIVRVRDGDEGVRVLSQMDKWSV